MNEQRKPLLEPRKIYVNEKSGYSLIFFVNDVTLYDYGSICYFVTSINNLKGCEDSIHDCGGYMWEDRTSYYNLMTIDEKSVRPATEEEIKKFVTNIRSRYIRELYGMMTDHPNWHYRYRNIGD